MLCRPRSQGHVFAQRCAFHTFVLVVVHMLFLAGLMGIITVGAVAFIDIELDEDTGSDTRRTMTKLGGMMAMTPSMAIPVKTYSGVTPGTTPSTGAQVMTCCTGGMALTLQTVKQETTDCSDTTMPIRYLAARAMIL